MFFSLNVLNINSHNFFFFFSCSNKFCWSFHSLFLLHILTHNHNKSVCLYLDIYVNFGFVLSPSLSFFLSISGRQYFIEREKKKIRDCRIDLFGGIRLKIGVKKTKGKIQSKYYEWQCEDKGKFGLNKKCE